MERKMAIQWRLLGLVALSLTSLLMIAKPASAQTSATGPQAIRDDGDFVVDELFTVDGVLLSTKAFTHDGAEIPVPASYIPFDTSRGRQPSKSEGSGRQSSGGIVPAGSGGGGSPGSSGCRSVTVNNEEVSTLGFTLLWWHSQTYWCWEASTYSVYSVQTTEWASDIDLIWSYLGITYDHEGWYAYVSGQSSSGYYNDKQAHFQSCLAWICQNLYPYNQLWSFYDGSYQWNTSG
jgi:hypothetical protein